MLNLSAYLGLIGVDASGDWIDINGYFGTPNAIIADPTDIDTAALGHGDKTFRYCHPDAPVDGGGLYDSSAAPECTDCQDYTIPVHQCPSADVDAAENIEICEGQDFELTGDTEMDTGTWQMTWHKDAKTNAAFRTANNPQTTLTTGQLPSTDVGGVGDSRTYLFVVENTVMSAINLGPNDRYWDGTQFVSQIPESKYQSVKTVTVTVVAQGDAGQGGQIVTCVA